MIDGRLRAATRGLTSGDGGGVVGPEDACTKTGQPMYDVLQSKHPNLMVPELDREVWALFERYGEGEVPALILLDCTAETVEEIYGKMRGGAGPSSVDAPVS